MNFNMKSIDWAKVQLIVHATTTWPRHWDVKRKRYYLCG